MQEIYDQFVVEKKIDKKRNYTKDEPLTYSNSLNGDTYFTNESKLLTYISKLYMVYLYFLMCGQGCSKIDAFIISLLWLPYYENSTRLYEKSNCIISSRQFRRTN